MVTEAAPAVESNTASTPAKLMLPWYLIPPELGLGSYRDKTPKKPQAEWLKGFLAKLRRLIEMPGVVERLRSETRFRLGQLLMSPTDRILLDAVPNTVLSLTSRGDKFAALCAIGDLAWPAKGLDPVDDYDGPSILRAWNRNAYIELLSGLFNEDSKCWLIEADEAIPYRPSFEKALANVMEMLHEDGTIADSQVIFGIKSVEAPSQGRTSPCIKRLSVDLKRLTATLHYDNGLKESVDVNNQQAARWLKVLAAQPGTWISASELVGKDAELDGARTDRLRKKLPRKLARLIQTSTRTGSRLKLA